MIEEIIDEEKDFLKMEQTDNQNDEKKITIWRILAYFVIYSIIGYLVETLFCLARYGVLESRKSFLYGPFCGIYGIGAIVIIISLQHFKKNYNTLFVAGCIVGSIVEYVISFLGEVILKVRWWDYSDMPLNLNGRICLLYAAFWGFLSLYLMISLNPKIDRLIDWLKKRINIKIMKTLTLITIFAMILDFIISLYAVSCFMIRMIKINDINVQNREEVNTYYEKLYGNEKNKEIINEFFNDKVMVKTYPRLKVTDINGNIIYFSDLLPDIQAYYFKLPNIKYIKNRFF